MLHCLCVKLTQNTKRTGKGGNSKWCCASTETRENATFVQSFHILFVFKDRDSVV